MKFGLKLTNISKNESNFYKGIGILLIVLHNIYHFMGNSSGENEFNFSENRINLFFEFLRNEPLDFINLFLSYFGHYGVQLFFFISGYGLMKAYGNKNPRIFQFVFRRIKKLYPTFILAILSFMAFKMIYLGWGFNDFSFQSIFLKITFLANFFPYQALSMNGPWWFYSAIVQLYVLFPILLRLREKFGQKSYLIILIINYVFIILFYEYFDERNISIYYQAIGQLPVFLAGMFLAEKGKFKFNKLILIPAFIIFALGNFMHEFWYFSNLMLIILLIPLFEKAKSGLNKNGKFYKSISFYGKISMYLFATHAFFRPMFIHYTGSNIFYNLLIVLGFLIFTSAFALFIKFIEKYLLMSINYLKSAFKRFDSKFKSKSRFSKKLHKAFSAYFTFIISLIISFVILKLFEYFSLNQMHSFSLGSGMKLIPPIGSDVFFIMSITSLMVFLFSFYLINEKLGKSIIAIIYSTLIITYYLLIEYFKTTFIPLDHALLSYSFRDIVEIALSSSELNILTYVGIVLVIVLISVFFIIHRKIKIGFSAFLSLFILGIISMIYYNSVKPRAKDYNSVSEFYFSSNKVIYFANSLIENMKENNTANFTNIEIRDNAKAWRSEFNFEYSESEMYPFYRKEDTENVLKPFFNLNPQEKPNIVFIIVESLSSSFSSKNPYLGSFTPFLDSLRVNSLHWRNMLATSERTFGVLPSTLASLTYGKEGITNMGFTAPDHLSMLSIMQNWNYHTSFIHGGWQHFNKMDDYLDKNNIKYRLKNFSEYDKIPENAKGFSWGYGDSVIFEKAKKVMDDSIAFEPYFSVYLTLSIHSPFNLHNEDFWLKKAHNKIDELYTDKEKRDNLKKYDKTFATILFTDNTLKRFFEFYKKRDDYENTIFIITGDHRMGPVEHISPIDKYHVPMIVYSEMLTRNKEIGGISSHLDIAPSFLKLLSEEYDEKMPEYCHWLGSSLDTNSEFNARKILPFMRNNKNIEDLIYKDYFIAKEQLYKINDNMKLEKIEDNHKKEKLSNLLESFKVINLYATIRNKIIPIKDYLENINSKILVQKEVDFEGNLDDYYNKKLSKANFKSLSHSVLVNKNHIYAPILDKTEISSNYSKLDIKVNFFSLIEILNENNLPQMVITLVDKDNKNLIWKNAKIFTENNTKEGKWQEINYSTSLIIPTNNSEVKYLKIYIWNGSKFENMYYDDLKIDIFAYSNDKKL